MPGGGGRGEPGPGPAASCRRRTGLHGVPEGSSLFPLHLHWSTRKPEPSAPGSAQQSARRWRRAEGAGGGGLTPLRMGFLGARGRSGSSPPCPCLPRARSPRRSSSPPPRWSSDVAPEEEERGVRGGAGSMALGFPGLLRSCAQAAAMGLAAHPGRRERARARNVLGTFCPQLLGRPRRPLRSSLAWETINRQMELSTVSSLLCTQCRVTCSGECEGSRISPTSINSHTDSLLELVRLANTKMLQSGLRCRNRSVQSKRQQPCVPASSRSSFCSTTCLKTNTPSSPGHNTNHDNIHRIQNHLKSGCSSITYHGLKVLI